MKIIEQYLKAVGTRLPWRSRKDIVDELRAILMDQIEGTYGSEPSEDEVKAFLTGYGSPSLIASRYKNENPVIAEGLSDLFRLIILIMAGAMMVAFTVVGIIDILGSLPSGFDLFRKIINIPLEAFSGWLGGIGMVTLIFMGMSRFMKNPDIDLDDKWKVEDLKDVELNEKHESRLESYITIGFLSLFIVLLNVNPGIVTVLENLFARSGLGPHHLLVIERFRFYVYILTVFWIIGIILRILILRSGAKSKAVELTEVGLSLGEILLDVLMLTDAALFVAIGNGGWIGFKVILVITLVANSAELLGGIYRYVKGRIISE